MAGVLTNVVKGSMIGNADNRLRQRTGETAADYECRLKELLSWLTAGKPLLEHATTLTTCGKDRKVADGNAEKDHVNEFLGDPPQPCFFPNMLGDSEDDIVRGGYIQAIQLALGTSPPKPIVSYWIITGRQDTDLDGFEVFVAESDREVHVLILTPMPAFNPVPPLNGRQEDMFIVATTQRIQDIDQNVWPKGAGYPRTPSPLPGTVGVGCLRVLSY
jgi:hypothetical protein